MKTKLFTLLLAIMATTGTIFAESGTCGYDLTWDLTNGVLIISGTGAIEDYRFDLYTYAPWYESRSSITSLIINEGVTSIGYGNFYECTNLISATIPNSVTSIGSYAFYDCTGLTSVTIPNSIVSIGESAFRLCKSLTSITLPNSVTSIGDNAFRGCTGLTSPVYNSHIFAYMPVSFIGAYTIMIGIELIAGDAFYNCTGLTAVTIPESVTGIGNNAFYGCSGLISMTIPNSVTSIGDQVFYKCTELTSPIYNAHVFAYLPPTYSGSFTVPSGIKSIAGGAFYKCTDLISVTMPNSVTDIGNDTFRFCSNLTSVTLSNHITRIGFFAFEECGSLTSIDIPNSVTRIEYAAFHMCTGLTSITMGNGIESIDYGAFSMCDNLTSVHISDIAAWCKISFTDYTSNPLFLAHNLIVNTELVTDLVIPDTITSIGAYAFYACSFTSVTIGSNVTRIEKGAFHDCSQLRMIYSKPIMPPTILSNTFRNIPTDAIVYVPNVGLDAYKTATHWTNLNIQPASSSQCAIAPTSVSITLTNIIWNHTEDRIAYCEIEGGGTFEDNTFDYIGLEPASENRDIHISITSANGESDIVRVTFTTPNLTLSTQPSKPVSSNTAILLAETNMADIETSCGFEWKRNDAPEDMAPNKVVCPVANGTMAGRLKNLKDDVYYKYRAFYQSAAGNMYYGEWQYIFTGDVAVEFDPILYTYAASAVTENSAVLKGYALAGSDDFTEQGFEYWSESRVNPSNTPLHMPAELGEHQRVTVSGISMKTTLTNLEAGTVYRYRTYAKIGDQLLYGSEMTFTTQGEYVPPTYVITFVNWNGTELQSSSVEENTMPEYTGDTPVREEDEQYTYIFNGWSPALAVVTADATYTATYTAHSKYEAVEQVQADTSQQAHKILRNGQILILRGDKVYTLTGQEVK